MNERTTVNGLDHRVSPTAERISYLILILLGLAMRLWDLDDRAFHHDESLHAFYSWRIVEGGIYQYNPLMHGPFQFFGSALLFFFLGDSDATARVLYALFGTLLIGMPWLLRDHISRIGALFTAVLLAFSPTLLYFSRFARNDILMVVWTFGMVVAIWRYRSREEHRYLYYLAVFMALAFVTKETIYLTLFGLVGALSFVTVYDWFNGRRDRRSLTRTLPLLVVITTLAAPQSIALISVLQGPLGITLANADHASGIIGYPYGVGRIVATLLAVAVLGGSVAVGLRWNWRSWLICAGLFYAIWILFFSGFLTDFGGLPSGIWRGLGYWVVQQDVGRGSQPWYYYLVAGGTYEFLALMCALASLPLLIRRGSSFGWFLIVWAIINSILFTVAGEKMPWLVAHLVLPLILLAGWTLGKYAAMIHWEYSWHRVAICGVVFFPLMLLFTSRLVLHPLDRSVPGFLILWMWIGVILGSISGMLWMLRKLSMSERLPIIVFGLAAMIFGLTFQSAWRVNYLSGDVPTELMVYTQTSPDVRRIAKEIDHIAASTGYGFEMPIVVDSEGGFSWPWAWYLRDYRVSFPSYSDPKNHVAPDAAVLIVNAVNNSKIEHLLADDFASGHRFQHRSWFPESYRNMNWGGDENDLLSWSVWHSAYQYWLLRELETPLGSADAHVYYSKAVRAEMIAPNVQR
jgi:uncharacterized protein (TIGR03663 family)